MKFTVGLLFALTAFCSGKNIDIDKRIVGGLLAEENQFPHQIAIIYKERLRCGGSIISPLWILTAAHCVADNTGTLVGCLLNKSQILDHLNSYKMTVFRAYRSLREPTR